MKSNSVKLIVHFVLVLMFDSELDVSETKNLSWPGFCFLLVLFSAETVKYAAHFFCFRQQIQNKTSRCT